MVTFPLTAEGAADENQARAEVMQAHDPVAPLRISLQAAVVDLAESGRGR